MTVYQLVERERSQLRRLAALEGVALATAAAAAALVAGVAALGGSRWITLPAASPFFVWALVLAGTAYVVWYTVRAASARGSRASVASAIERDRALRAGALRGALEVQDAGALGRRAAERVAAQLGSHQGALTPTLRRSARRRGAIAAAGALAMALALVGFRGAWPDGWTAVAHPVRAWRGTLLPALRVDAPGVALRGERVTVTLEAPGRRQLVLHSRATGSAWRQDAYAVDSSGRVRVALPPLDADVSLVVGDGRGVSDTVVMRVTDRPFVGDVALRATYPAYLGRAPEPLPVGETARVPRGTVLTVDGRASTALDWVRLVRGADTMALRPDGLRFTGRFTAEESGRWSWLASGTSGPILDLPAPVELDVIPDSAPRVEITAPARDTIVAATGRVTLSIVATDDHGLASVSLRSWRQPAGAGAQPEVVQRLGAPGAPQWTGVDVVDVAARGLEPGDELHVVAVATDGSPWKLSGSSRELVLRVPTSAEQRALARQAADSAVAVAQAAAEAQRSLQQRTSDAARSRGQRNGSNPSEANAGGRGGQSPLGFEQSEQAKALAKEQRALAEQVKKAQEAAKQLEKQLREAGALDSALADRLREARQLLQDAITPELAEQLRKLEESLGQLKADESRQAMGDLAAQQQRVREQLERSVEMLRRAALEGAMQTLHDEAKELAQQQRALGDSLARQTPGQKQQQQQQQQQGEQRANERPGQSEQDRASAKARQLADRSHDLAKDVGELTKRLQKEGAQTGAQKSASAQSHASESAEQMERAASRAEPRSEDASAGKEQTASSGQRPPREGAPSGGGQQQQQPQSGEKGGSRNASAARQAAGEMEQAAQQLGAARDQQIAEWKQELSQELDRSIQEMLQMARQEDELASQTQEGGDPQATRSEQSSIQQGVSKSAERLQQAGQKSSLVSPRSQRAVGEAKRRVEQATREASQANGSQSGRQQSASAMRDAAEALNQAAASLVRDRERANNASSASGFAEMLQEMQEMAKQQGSLNAQAAGLSMMPGGQSGQQGQAARQLARQQRGLADRLEELGDADGSGRAQQLAQEAKQIAQALERGSVDQSLLDRQQRLFRRLLDAGKTLEQDEREETGKRESRAATNADTFSPTGDRAQGAAASKFREPTWNELRGLSPEERRLVLEYFRRINGAQP
ncbi:MAG TPA: hypothetical protein VKA84_28320 [Gemmatimonadaceae bacterium]|nr:hypothetical protein [Gemmatimonadaceae bacterium]